MYLERPLNSHIFPSCNCVSNAVMPYYCAVVASVPFKTSGCLRFAPKKRLQNMAELIFLVEFFCSADITSPQLLTELGTRTSSSSMIAINFAL